MTPVSSDHGFAQQGRLRGFTLIELAVVVAIIGLLLGGLLLPLATQMDARRVADTEDQLVQAKEAIFGFVVGDNPYQFGVSTVTTRLPCPDCMDNNGGCAGFPANDGQEDRPNLAGGSCATNVGNLPWVTLGVGEWDAWDRRLRYQVDLTFADDVPDAVCGNTRVSFGLCSQGNLTVEDADGNQVADSLPAVIVSMGQRVNRPLCTDPVDPSPVEDENADCDNTYVSNVRRDDPGNEFDDVITWVSGNLLRAKVLEVNQLP